MCSPPSPPALPHLALALFFLALASGTAEARQADGGAAEPRARALSRQLTAAARLAGTRGSAHAARWVGERLEEAGFTVGFEEYDVLLSYPRRIEIGCSTAGGEPILHRVETFDPDAIPPGDVPPYNAWSASGRVEAEVVDVGRGLRDDYERLAREGIAIAGRIALCRYGGSYRGVKAELAEELGCAALLLFDDPEEDGAERGATWPAGPWKPGWAAQRGSISPLARMPGDPSTPGWPSPRAGDSTAPPWPPPADLSPRPRLDLRATAANLPGIPCLPIGAGEARAILAAGAGARVLIDVDVPRVIRRIVNVVGRLRGRRDDWVLADNHRDAWVRGAQDAASGTISILRAAERLGRRARAGWVPENGIALAFWDAEEFGLIGSTEWGETHADFLRRHALAYVNADAVVSGLSFQASGTPGLLGPLRAALERVPAPLEPGAAASEEGRTLWHAWTADGEREPELGLPGSGSDYTVFLHHLGIPVLDVSFGGKGGGQYHTRFDDFLLMDRFLDPEWKGHETAGLLLAELLAELAQRGRSAFDGARAARAMARVAVEAGADGPWLGEERAARLATAFTRLAESIADAGPTDGPDFYRALEAHAGLAGRRWYRNRLWAPGLETGYSAETLPTLRAAARAGPETLEEELADLIAVVRRLAGEWRDRTAELCGGFR